MTNSFAPLLPRYILDPFFTRHTFSENSDTKMAFFRHTNLEEMNFVRYLSLSQQQTLARSETWFLPACGNKHLNGLIGETVNLKLNIT